MKKYRTILIVIGGVVLMVAPMLIVDAYKGKKSRQESARMYEIKAVLQQKLEAYHEANGRYPDSIDVLSFTNSPQEIGMLSDLKKVRYRLTTTDYAIGWDGEYVISR